MKNIDYMNVAEDSVDKIKKGAFLLETTDSSQIASPIIKIPGRHYECEIIYRSAMDPARLEKDYHTLYFGEILACY